jgi:hypothetical protein
VGREEGEQKEFKKVKKRKVEGKDMNNATLKTE